MLTFDDQLKNDALRTIIVLIDDPKFENVYEQAAQLLQVVSDSGAQVGGRNPLEKFMAPYIAELVKHAEAVPRFAEGIIFPSQEIDEKIVVRLLSLLRFDALKEENAETIVEFLTYYIEAFKLAFNVTPVIFKKFTIDYADYEHDLPLTLYYAFEAFSAPIGLLFKNRGEWESYKQLTKDLQCEESVYLCQFNATARPIKLRTDVIDELSEDKYPLRIRLASQKMYKKEECKNVAEDAALKAEAVKQIREVVGDRTPKRKKKTSGKNIFFSELSRKKLIILTLVLGVLGLATWAFFYYINADIEGWMLGEWKYQNTRLELWVDDDGEGIIDYYDPQRYQHGALKVRYNKITSKLWVDDERSQSRDFKNLPSAIISVLQGRIPIEVDSKKMTLSISGISLERSPELPRWIRGKWTGTTTSTDEFGRPIRLRLEMRIDKDGWAIEEAYKNGSLVDRNSFYPHYDYSTQQLYNEIGGRRIGYRLDYKNRTIKTSKITLYQEY